MEDIFHDFLVSASPARVFEAVSLPSNLEKWWTVRASGTPEPGAVYELGFGPAYDWRAVVRTCIPDAEIAWEFTQADPDWLGTRLGFHLTGKDDRTEVCFHHRGWPERNAHYRISCYCWAMYLRLLRRYVEHGEVVPYAQRLDV